MRYAACVRTVAASIELINAINGRVEDFTGEYSKTVFIFIPWDYDKCGCQVYSCGWIDFKKVINEDDGMKKCDIFAYDVSEKMIAGMLDVEYLYMELEMQDSVYSSLTGKSRQ